MKLNSVLLFLVNLFLLASGFIVTTGKWHKRHITYKINSFPHQLNKNVVRNEIRRAFNQWSSVVSLTFSEIYNGDADINIWFSNHYYSDKFDGPGYKNAFSFYPIYGGSIYFDIDEPWSATPYYGKSLFQIATHEIGHSLGLRHTSNRHDVMYEFYEGYITNFQLSKNDIYNIRV